MPLSLEIVTPRTAVAPRTVRWVDVPAASGRLRILPGHAALVCELAPGPVTAVGDDGVETTWNTGAGTVRVSADGEVTLLVRSAEARR